MYEKHTLEVDYHINIVTIIVRLYNNSGTIIVVGLQVIFFFLPVCFPVFYTFLLMSVN